MPTTRRASARVHASQISGLLAIIILASLASALVGSVAAAVPVTAGYRDAVAYGDPAAPGGDDVTANRSQSKLWTNDGFWFGLRFDPISTTNAKFRIWRFDMATQDWTNSTIAVDDRNRSHADVLSDGNVIYVASARAAGSVGTVGRDLRIYKYSYNTTSNTYALVAGFPKLIAGTAAGTGFSTIAKDGNGRLWVAFTQANRVRISNSADNGVNWSAPIDVPNMGNDMTTDDTAAIATMNGGVGVLWSNQTATDDAFYFVAHANSDPVGTWQARETAFGTTNEYDADGHISLKTDAAGDLLAAVKTNRNDDPAPNGGDPLITVLKRTGSAGVVGSWASHPVTSVTVGGTRPILVLDDAANEANVFLTNPEQASAGQQSIYRRTAPLSTLNFGAASLGTLFISSVTETAINDATSTKQRTTAATGILVEATNIPTRHYLHNCVGGPCPVRPVANFTGTPTSGLKPLTVQFTDTSTNTPTSWAWTFGDGGTSTAKNPSHIYANAATYTVTLTATNVAGGDIETKTNYITVSNPPPPVANFTGTPTSGIKPLTVQFTDTSTNTPTSWAWDFDNNGSVDSTAKNPSHIYATAGSYTVKLTATNGGGSDVETKANYVVVSNPPPPVANFTGTPTSGTAPLTVKFTDTSTNAPTSWAWDFDNNGSVDATAKNPSHVYANPGTYSVRLTATNSGGSDAETKTGYITVQQPPETIYKSLTPVRVLDTRPGINKGLAGAFQAKVPRTLSIAGANGIPANAVAITGNLTVVGQTRAGYLSITRNPTANPTTSILNFPVGDTRANGVTVPLNGTGDLSIVYMASSGSTHVLLDVTGYFRVATDGTTFYEKTPVRVLDSRVGTGLSGAFLPSIPRTLSVAGANGIPAAARAITGNLTVVGQTRAGYLSITPNPTATPTTSTINFPVGDTRANGVTVPLNGSGDLSIVYKASGGTAHVVLDVTGYFLDGTAGKNFVPVDGSRILDTRFGNGLSNPFSANTPRTWAVANRGGVASSAVAIIGNVTVVGQTKAGYVSLTPTAQANPTTSTINFPLGDIRPNNFTVQLSGTGSLSGVYKAPAGAKTQLIVDVFGYYK
jgi:PKD repeat protein